MSAPAVPRAGPVVAPRRWGRWRWGRWRRFGSRYLPVGLLPPLLALLVWQLAVDRGAISTVLLPAPVTVLRALAEMARSGALAADLAATLRRLGLGALLGASAGLLAGVAVGASGLARRLLDPTVQGLRAVPSLAWVPLFILWFGIFEQPKVLLIAVGVFFPVYLNFVAGLAGCDRRLIEVGHVCGLGRLGGLWHIRIPASLPMLMVGLRGGLGLGWMFVAAAELMGASTGLGFELMDGEQTGRPERVIAALVVFALCGKTTDLAMSWLARRVSRWR